MTSCLRVNSTGNEKALLLASVLNLIIFNHFHTYVSESPKNVGSKGLNSSLPSVSREVCYKARTDMNFDT
jgi:hypothetical protein